MIQIHHIPEVIVFPCKSHQTQEESEADKEEKRKVEEAKRTAEKVAEEAKHAAAKAAAGDSPVKPDSSVSSSTSP